MSKQSGQAPIFKDDEQREALTYELKEKHQSIVKLVHLTVSRPSEITSLQWRQINGNTLSIKMHKTKNYKQLKITPNIKTVLDTIQPKTETGSAYLYPSKSKQGYINYTAIAKDIRNCRELLGYSELFTCYSWRRSAATSIYLALKDDPTVPDPYQALQQLSGHASILNLIKYIDIDKNAMKSKAQSILG